MWWNMLNQQDVVLFVWSTRCDIILARNNLGVFSLAVWKLLRPTQNTQLLSTGECAVSCWMHLYLKIYYIYLSVIELNKYISRQFVWLSVSRDLDSRIFGAWHSAAHCCWGFLSCSSWGFYFCDCFGFWLLFCLIHLIWEDVDEPRVSLSAFPGCSSV